MIYDITPPITPAAPGGSTGAGSRGGLQVWPGDTPPSREVLSAIKDGATTTLSTLHATVHLGAHADAPSHYGLGAPSIDQRPLEDYLGPCQVIHVNTPRGTSIEPLPLTFRGARSDSRRASHVRNVKGGAVKVDVQAPRVLFATGTYPDPAAFNEDFAALSTALVEALARSGVKLVGIDTPSVDLFESSDLPVHKACLTYDVAILEGLVLDKVPDGVYELIALPLRLTGFDASPVRAILRSLGQRR